MKLTKENALLAAGGVVAVLLLYKLTTRGVQGTMADLTGGIITGAVDAVSGVVGGAYSALPEPIKPSSDKNIIYRGASSLVQALPGSAKDETLGTWIYGLFNDD